TSAWAEEPPCPGQAQTPAATGNPPPAQPAASPPRKNVASGGKIDVASDSATLGVDGNAVLQGNVEVQQADRQIKANENHDDSKNNSVRTDGGIDYTDPVAHVVGEGGSYSPNQGANFKSAQFELRQRAARGSAKVMQLTPEGVIHLEGVTFTTCPQSDRS